MLPGAQDPISHHPAPPHQSRGKHHAHQGDSHHEGLHIGGHKAIARRQSQEGEGKLAPLREDHGAAHRIPGLLPQGSGNQSDQCELHQHEDKPEGENSRPVFRKQG